MWNGVRVPTGLMYPPFVSFAALAFAPPYYFHERRDGMV